MGQKEEIKPLIIVVNGMEQSEKKSDPSITSLFKEIYALWKANNKLVDDNTIKINSTYRKIMDRRQ